MQQTYHICFLTILNSTQHPRIFDKQGKAALKLNWKVSVIGADDHKNDYVQHRINILPIGITKRFSLKRFFLPFIILLKAYKLKANLYHIHTPELLLVGIILKVILNAKIIYDVHEDYQLNILYSNTYYKGISGVLAHFIRIKEKSCSLFYDRIAYAEECFVNILNIPEFKFAIIRNTYKPYEIDKEINCKETEDYQPYCIVSGNIAFHWGVIDAIDLFEKIKPYIPHDMIIIGYGKDEHYKKLLVEKIKYSRYSNHIKVIGLNQYVKPDLITHYIKNAEFGFALYIIDQHIKDRIPTKFYEYMHHKIPLIYSENKTWDNINTQFNFGISYSKNRNILDLVMIIQNKFPYCFNETIPKEYYSWHEDEKRLIDLWFNVANFAN